MPSNSALDDNPITETSRRLPLRNYISNRTSYSPSPQRSHIDSESISSTFSDDMRLASPALIHRWHHKHSILSTAAFPKLGLLFCGTHDHQILVFDMVTFERKYILHGHTGSVLCLARSEDEKYLVSGGSDSLVKVWDISTMKESHTIYSLVDIGDIFSITWSQKLNTIYFGCQNASILFVHLLDTIPKDDPSSLPSNRFDKFFDSKGPTGTTSSQTRKITVQSRLIEVPSSNIIRYAHNGFVYALKIHQGKLISGGGDGIVKIWKPSENLLQLQRELENEDGVLSLTAFESLLYCGLTSGQVKVWDLNTYQQILSFFSEDEEDQEDVLAVAATNHCLFKGTKGGVLKWKFGSETKHFWEAHTGSVLTAEIFDKNGKVLLVTGGNDSSVSIWDITGENPITIRRTSVIELDNESLLTTLRDVVSFRTISKKPELYIDESRRCADYLKDLFKKVGADSEIISVEDGNPIVYSVFKAKRIKSDTKVPRILWYGHYDIIEADNLDGWNTNPYELTAHDGYLHGRGVSDNKGPILAAIYAVADLLSEGLLTSDVVFLIEGEEECGSFGFQETIKKHRHLLGEVDWLLLSNSYWLDENTPCLNYGLRGVISATVEILSDKPDRHSGVDGGVSREPTVDLIRLLSKLSNDDGKISIPKFYEPIKPLSKEEERKYDEVISKANIKINKETLLAKWKFPSLTVHKIDVSGPGNSTVIPKSAKGSLSIRIVPEQNLEEVKQLFVSYLTDEFKKFNSDNHLEIRIIHEAEPWLGDCSNDAFKFLREAVVSEWGIEPLFVREGGSIPNVRFLEKMLDAPAAQIPCGQSTDNAHLNNEKLRVSNLYTLRRILKRTFQQLPSRK